MRAIILAAGIGSRLHPITLEKPKTLVTVNNRPMIDYIVESLLHAGITDIVVCTGYRSNQLKAHLSNAFTTKAKITFVENETFESTNNMYSLYLAREYLCGDVMLMNADLVFDKEIMAKLAVQPGCAIAVDKGNYLEEAMKLVVTDKHVSAISKQIARDEAYGSSIDIYKLDASATEVLSSYIKKIIEVEGQLNQWTEVLLDRVFKEGLIQARPFDIGTLRWYEIDNFTDLAAAELLFNEKLAQINKKKLFLLDKDGTLAIGKTAIPGAAEFLKQLNSAGKKLVVASNNSSRTSEEHGQKLREIFANELTLQVITSLDHAISALKAKGVVSLYAVANSNVSSYLGQFFEFASINPDALLLTYDDELDYKKMRNAIRLVNAGIPYYATHIDMVCPTEAGNIPDIGTFIETIAACTGVRPKATFGKPTREYLNYLLKECGAEQEDAVLIGDRLYTDIESCTETKVTSILVLSGETTRADYEFSDCRADIIVPSIEALRKFIQ